MVYLELEEGPGSRTGGPVNDVDAKPESNSVCIKVSSAFAASTSLMIRSLSPSESESPMPSSSESFPPSP